MFKCSLGHEPPFTLFQVKSAHLETTSEIPSGLLLPLNKNLYTIASELGTNSDPAPWGACQWHPCFMSSAEWEQQPLVCWCVEPQPRAWDGVRVIRTELFSACWAWGPSFCSASGTWMEGKIPTQTSQLLFPAVGASAAESWGWGEMLSVFLLLRGGWGGQGKGLTGSLGVTALCSSLYPPGMELLSCWAGSKCQTLFLYP